MGKLYSKGTVGHGQMFPVGSEDSGSFSGCYQVSQKRNIHGHRTLLCCTGLTLARTWRCQHLIDS